MSFFRGEGGGGSQVSEKEFSSYTLHMYNELMGRVSSPMEWRTNPYLWNTPNLLEFLQSPTVRV